MNNSKIHNVREIDPVFQINGKKYVTYLPDSIGQKVQVWGESRLEGKVAVMDLSAQPKGSDLWLFWHIVDRDSIVPFVSPQDEASLYAYIKGPNLIIKLLSGKEDVKFSYYLVGTRIDHKDDGSHLYSDQSIKDYINIDTY